MGSKNSKSQSGISRREVLGKGAALLGIATALSLPFKLFHGFSPSHKSFTDLPGDGSIFQPRKDQNLRNFLKDKSL